MRKSVEDLELPTSTDSAGREAEVAMGMAWRNDGLYDLKVQEWRLRTYKCSVGRSPMRWTDDIRRAAGSKRSKTMDCEITQMTFERKYE
ncbi:jg2313 [Pararge aegeria aegeria]|uniref:Jg2313 protein n=1 Tax=Pararge aegeria aegeria TaxID=348720 RepID=A0A8S4SEI5_9NEOP|nr:jg2313 [Pararge aegeria aegeria]